MSGTSLDGVDVAFLETDGERIASFGPSETFPFSDPDRALLRQATLDARDLVERSARPGCLRDAEALVTERHAEAVERFLAQHQIDSTSVDLIGFHGQTVFHDPARALTAQIGDGDRLAARLGMTVAWDFRADDMAAGGQGAPLAPVFHRALAEWADIRDPVVFLNLGGVANITYDDRSGADGLVAFDTGPANALLDDWMRMRTGQSFDADGRTAAAGNVSQPVLELLLAHPYFALPPPKSLDRDAFSLSTLAGLSTEDGAATLVQFSVRSIARGLELLRHRPRSCYASGGGRRNRAMMTALREALPDVTVEPLEALGFDGDATEAQAFAFLAVRALERKPLSYPLTTGVARPLSGGRLSRRPKSG